MSRIVQLANFYGPQSGGLRVALDELGAGYVRAGQQRVLIVPGDRDGVSEDRGGLRITVRSPVLPGSGGYRVLTRRGTVMALLEQHRPDRLEISDKLSLGWVGPWAAERGVPCVLISHERLDSILRVRVPAWFPLERAAGEWNAHLLRTFGRVVCASTFAADEFAGLAGNVALVPLGVDLDVFAPRADTIRLTSASVELVTVGRLSKEKRLDLAIETVRTLVSLGVDAHLTMVGAGPEASRLAWAARDLPVRFVGHVADRRTVAALLASADVVLAPCPIETFGLAVLEGLAAATPVVVPDQGASQELIDARCGRTGAPTGAGLAAAVLNVLDLPVDDRRSAARARAESFPWSATVAGMLAVHGLAPAAEMSAAAPVSGTFPQPASAPMTVRPLRPGDDLEVRRIFRATLALGDQPAFVAEPGFARYEAFCLDWYLGPGRADAAVVELADGTIGGYALVCTDADGYDRWQRVHAAQFVAGLAAGFAMGRYHDEIARFYRLRVRDGWALWRSGASPAAAHAHLNLDRGLRGGGAARLLGDHVDARVAAAGLSGWYGEINALAGHRARALERLGGRVVHRAPNHTLTALLGKPVERLTVLRSLDARLPPRCAVSQSRSSDAA